MENRISIVVPVITPYLGIEEFCANVKKITFPGMDFIFVDGSNVENDFQTTISEPLRGHYTYIHAPGSNIYDAMNIGAKASHSRWLFFCGLDDKPMIDEELLSKLSTFENINQEIGLWCFVSPQPLHVYSLFCFFLILLARFDASKIKNNGMIISHQNMIFNKDYFLRSGCYDTSLRFTADFDLFVRSSEDMAVLVKASKKLICSRGTSGVSSRLKNRVEILNSFINILQSHGEKPSFFLLLLRYISEVRGDIFDH